MRWQTLAALLTALALAVVLRPAPAQATPLSVMVEYEATYGIAEFNPAGFIPGNPAWVFVEQETHFQEETESTPGWAWCDSSHLSTNAAGEEVRKTLVSCNYLKVNGEVLFDFRE